MFNLSVASNLFKKSTRRTLNCVINFAHLIWDTLNTNQFTMHESRKRYHSHSRSRSHSHLRDRSYERKKIKNYSNGRDRDRDGKRRKIESYDSPSYRKSVSSQRAHRSRQYERGSSAERRYKRSRRRSRTSKKKHYHDKKKHRKSSSTEPKSSRVQSVEDDEEGHLIYESGDILRDRCPFVTIEELFCAVKWQAFAT